MKKISLIFFFITSSTLLAQVDLTTGMGINVQSSSSLRDYININFAPAGEQLQNFSTVADFLCEGTYNLSSNLQIGIEYDYSIFSYNTNFGITGVYDLSYGRQSATAVIYYVIPGKGYKFKFGGGAGVRYASLTEKAISEQNYSTLGPGLLMRGEAHTSLGGNFYASILGSLRYDLPGDPKNDGVYLQNNVTGENVNLTSVSAGLTLGISYFF